MTGAITAYLGLGANLGDPVEQIISARKQLTVSQQVSDLRCSSLYVSSPVGYADQADFVNCVVSLQTTFDAHSLFEYVQGIELQLGRSRDPNNQNAARLIDIDILLFGDQHHDSPELTVPHPRMSERLFVLQPLRQLNPDLLVGDLGSVTELLEANRANGIFDDQELYRLGA